MANQAENYFVLAGLSVYEAQVDHVTRRLDDLAEKINPGDPASVEFHASAIYARRDPPWDRMSRDEAQGVIKLRVVAESYDSARVFACAVEKGALENDVDPVELAFEDLCSRFDRYLARLRIAGDTQRGLLILDKSTY